MISSTILFDDDKVSFFGDAPIPNGGGYQQNGFYGLTLDQASGKAVSGELVYSPVSRQSLPNSLFYALPQRKIAFSLLNGNRSIVFRDKYLNGAAWQNDLINVVLDDSNHVVKSRLINFKPLSSLLGGSFTEFNLGKTDCVIDAKNSFAFLNKGAQADMVAVIDSSDNVILSKAVENVQMPRPVIRDLDFLKNSRSISLYMTDTTAFNRTQQIEYPLIGQDGHQDQCVGTDSIFFIVKNAPLNQTQLTLDSSGYNIFQANDISASLTPYSFQKVELCKTVNVCNSLKLSADKEICIGNYFTVKATKNHECLRSLNWDIDSSFFIIGSRTDSSISLKSINSGSSAVKVSLNNCILSDSLLINVTKPPYFSLGHDTTICDSSTYYLRLPTGYKKYLWGNGDTTSSLGISASGNYSATVWDACNNYFSDTVSIRFSRASPNIKIYGDTILCPDQNATLRAGPESGIYQRFLWSNGSTDDSIVISKPGSYWVSVWDNCRNSFSDTIVVTILDASLDIGSGQTICRGDSAFLSSGNDYLSYNWTPTNLVSSPNKSSTFVSPQKTTTFILSATSLSRCILTDSVVVNVNNCNSSIHFPTAFTPNNDGLNDIYKPIVVGTMARYHFSVYNRFGGKVFETSRIQDGWNGMMNGISQQTGVYIWICEYQFINEPLKPEKGSFLLIR